MRAMALVVFAMALLLWASMGSSHAAAAHDEAPPPWAQGHLRRLLARQHHKVDAIVVPGGGGGNHYGSIAEALAAAPPLPGRDRAGIYREAVNITRAQVILIGDGMGRTVLTGNRSKSTGHDMPHSAILTVMGNGFMARDITIRNTAGVSAGPAVALMSLSDKSVYYRCELDGFKLPVA